MPHIYDVSEIREKRIQLDISQNKMADVLKVSISTYKRYEKEGDMYISQAKKCTEYLKGIEEVENKAKR